MASSKTKRMAVTALSATLLLGGVAAAQAHETGSAVCAGKGKGEGTGAPGKDKGKGEGTGAPGKDKGKGEGTGAPSADRRPGCKDEDKGKPENTDGGQPGEDIETPGTGSESPGGGGAGNDSTVSIDIDINVDPDTNVPDPGQLAEDIAQDVLGIVTPVALNAAGQTVEIAAQVTDRAHNDVSALVGLLDSAMTEAASLDAGSVDAALSVDQEGATAAFNAGGTTSAVSGLVSRMLLAI